MTVYYNEFDPYAAAWLRNLIAARHLPAGEVDERDIREVSPADLRRFTQCHFFGGIGGWPLALKLAGWGDRPVWTGSCPCQPFSAAGQRKGTADERHLWPEFFRLIAECRPECILGEQVESAVRHGWLDGVFSDLEGEGYACAAAVLGAHSVGAPHIRQRLWWVADSGSERQQGQHALLRAEEAGRHESAFLEVAGSSTVSGMGHASSQGSGRNTRAVSGTQAESQREGQQSRRVADELVDAGDVERLEQPKGNRWVERRPESGGWGAAGGCGQGFWSAYDIVPCADGKARRIESAAQRLVDGLPGSLGPVRSDIIEKIEAEIVAYGTATGLNTTQSLRDLWSFLQAEAESLRSVGERADLFETAVLLALLCQLSQQGWHLAQGIPCEGTKAAQRVLRMLREHKTAACPPCKRGLDEQRPGKPTNPVHLLSSILARHAQEAWISALKANAAAVFPLASGVTNRVGKLRAYGNAIVPQVAAEFIHAYLLE